MMDALDVLTNASSMIASNHPRIHPRISQRSRAEIKGYIETLMPELARADLELCLRGAERLVRNIDQMDSSAMLVADFNDLRRRILDQAQSMFCLLLSPQEARQFQQASPFGAEVEARFPSANEDIYEATKCLALGRGTACVMHLMRVVESGLKCLAETLGVGDQGDWGAYIRAIESELELRIRAAGKRTADEQFYAEAKAMIDNVRRAWRNPTMHVERTYSPERADEIYRAVRSLMNHLATKLAEYLA
jgi:hypothetical protein